MTKQEIGSEFWEIPLKKTNDFFSEKTCWFSSGRNALRIIIKDIKKQKQVKIVAMPSWCCDSMILPFLQEGIKVLFYPVYIKEGKLYQKINETADIIFLIDYFGNTSSIGVSNKNKIIIRDLTHSIFSKNYEDADYYFGSLRKWAGFYTGGFALKKEKWNIPLEFKNSPNEYLELRRKGMQEKKEYLLGKREDKNYLGYFNEAEAYLDKTDEIYLADIEDIEKVKKLDLEFIKSKRYKNAKYLLENINFNDEMQPIFKDIKENEVPLFFTILANKRDDLRKKLIENNIYCPIHWRISEYHKLDEQTKYIYEHELSIICDQRYDLEDMERICKIINEWGN